MPGGLVTVGAGTLLVGFGVLGAGVLHRCGLGFERRPQLGLFPGGGLAELGHLLVGGGAGPVQLGVGRLGSLLRPGRLLPGSPGGRLGLLRPAVRAAHRLVPLLLRRQHPLGGGPFGLGDPGLRGFPRGRRRLLGGRRRRLRLRQLRSGLQHRGTRLLGVGLSLLGAGPELGAGVLHRCGLGFERRPQLGLFPGGGLAELGHLLVGGGAGPVQLGVGRFGSLLRPGRLLPGSPGGRLGLLRPAVRAAHRVVPLLLRRQHPLGGGPFGLGNPGC